MLAALPRGLQRGAAATLHWVAKEAALKAWDSWCAGALRGVDPTLLEVELGVAGALRVQPAGALAARGLGLPTLSGLWRDGCGLVAAVVTAPAGGAPPEVHVEASPPPRSGGPARRSTGRT